MRISEYTPPDILIKKPAFRSFFERAVTLAMIGIGLAVICSFGAWWFRGHVPSNFSGTRHLFDYAIFCVLTYVVWYQVINEILSWEIALYMRTPRPMAPKSGLKVALVTAFVPGKEPYDVLENTLCAMVQVRYEHDTWLLDEGNDVRAKALCAEYGVMHYSRHGKPHFNTETGAFKARTKAGNYNAWFHEFGNSYEIVAQHDVDFVPVPEYLERTLGYFRDPLVAFVGTPQIYGNVADSWIVRGAAEQQYGFYGSTQKGLFGMNMPLFIGANHIIRTSAHNDISGYAGHIVEDHLTGMRLYGNHWKGVYVPEALLIGEGPSTWGAYFSQQMRWAYGLIDILFRYSPKIIPRMRPRHAIHYFLLQQYYFYGLAQFLGIALLVLYFVFGIESTDMEAAPLLTLYGAFLAVQLGIFLWLQRFYIDPNRESGLHLRGRLLTIAAGPIYLLALISALIGKRLTYEVTPKGSAQTESEPPSIGLFIAHGALGTVTALCIVFAFLNDRTSPQLLFWAILNTICMYYFLLAAIVQNVLVAAHKHAVRVWA